MKLRVCSFIGHVSLLSLAPLFSGPRLSRIPSHVQAACTTSQPCCPPSIHRWLQLNSNRLESRSGSSHLLHDDAAVGLQLPHFDLDTVFAATPSSSFATLPIFRSGSSHPRLLALPSNSVFGPFVEARLLIHHLLISKVQAVHDSTSVPSTP